MTFDDLIRKHRFASHAARELGIARSTLYHWRHIGRIPDDRAKGIRRIWRQMKVGK